MSTTPETVFEDRIVNSLRKVVGLSGLVALIIGLLILLWPGHSAAVVAGIIAVYALVAGLIYLASAAFARGDSGWARIGQAILGALFIVAGIVALANLGATTAVLGVVLGTIVGIVWILEGVLRLARITRTPRPGWTVLSALISLVAGVIVLLSPLWGAAVLWLFLGISLVVIGISQIIRAFTLKK